MKLWFSKALYNAADTWRAITCSTVPKFSPASILYLLCLQTMIEIASIIQLLALFLAVDIANVSSSSKDALKFDVIKNISLLDVA